jgi:hypothetical protein
VFNEPEFNLHVDRLRRRVCHYVRRPARAQWLLGSETGGPPASVRVVQVRVGADSVTSSACPADSRSRTLSRSHSEHVSAELLKFKRRYGQPHNLVR